MVKFAPGARTAWHSHGLGQTTYIVEGIALIQSRGGVIIKARPATSSTHPPARSTGTAPTPGPLHDSPRSVGEPGPDGPPENNWLEHVARR